MLIAGDPSFSYLLSVLRMRNHKIVVLGPGGRPNADNNSSASLASQANLWLDWNTEVVDNIRIVIPRWTATGGSSALQTTEDSNPTPNTRSKRTSESREKRASAMVQDTSERMKPLADKDYKAEVNSIVDSLDEEEEAYGQQPTRQSTPQESSSVELDSWSTGWQWDPIASANTKASPILSPTESEDLPQDPTVNLTPTITTPATEAETVQDSPYKPQPRYTDTDWEGSPNSTQSTQLRDSAPVAWSAPSSAKPSEDYSWDDWPPLQATLGSSAPSQTPSQPNGNPPEYTPSDDSDWVSPEKAPVSFNGVTPHFQTSAAPSAPEPQLPPPAPQDVPVVVPAPQQLAPTTTTTPVVASLSSNAPSQTQIVPPAAASTPTQATTPLAAAAPASTSASTPSKSQDGVAPHFQHLIDVLRDFRSQGITSVERGGNIFTLLQKRDPKILVAAGTAQYRSPFVLYLEDAHEAGIITSSTGPIQLAPKYR
ncbi:hypothetical protein H1R20_g7010, partial [Candolleomyces eurysporus]